MSEGEQVDALVADLTRVIDRYRAEFQITLAAAIGTLETIKLDLWHEHSNPEE